MKIIKVIAIRGCKETSCEIEGEATPNELLERNKGVIGQDFDLSHPDTIGKRTTYKIDECYH